MPEKARFGAGATWQSPETQSAVGPSTVQPPHHPQATHRPQAVPHHQDDELSGPRWVARFPTSQSVDTLAQPFRGDVTRFIAALRTAGAGVSIAATRRPPERAYLMHYSYLIAHTNLDPRHVPPMAAVHIQWVHHDAHGRPDFTASRHAALQMAQGYGIVHRPALASRHTQGLAIDMNIHWVHDLVIVNGAGRRITITTAPRSGAGNSDLHAVGLTFGVHKLRTDPPHWSSDGH